MNDKDEKFLITIAPPKEPQSPLKRQNLNPNL